MFVKNISTRYVAQAPFVYKLYITNANKVYWLVEDNRKGIVAVLLARINATA